MLEIIELHTIKKDLKKSLKRGKDMSKLKALVRLLIENKPLAEKYDDHKLNGKYEGWRECKMESDWILVYKKTKTHLILFRIGQHSDIFNNF